MRRPADRVIVVEIHLPCDWDVEVSRWVAEPPELTGTNHLLLIAAMISENEDHDLL